LVNRASIVRVDEYHYVPTSLIIRKGLISLALESKDESNAIEPKEVQNKERFSLFKKSHCPKCGSKISFTYLQCPNCGTKLK
jgi:hypothetical protein